MTYSVPGLGKRRLSSAPGISADRRRHLPGGGSGGGDGLSRPESASVLIINATATVRPCGAGPIVLVG